ncbi:MAG: hypothetical protein SPK31_04210, partial [Alloprevotella sp.]|nr:hypothetical protein [Prevotellamassilia sp.]MDY5762286.1 hypothetical protein [Alloprevotella sp.]
TGDKVSARRAEWQEKLVFIDIPEPQPNLHEVRVSARRAEWQEKLVFIDIPEPQPNLHEVRVSANECRDKRIDVSFSFGLCRM